MAHLWHPPRYSWPTTGKFALNASMPALYVATSTPEDAATDGHVNPEPTGSHIRNPST